MTRRTSTAASFALAFCAFSILPAAAGELRRDQLPADTDWVLHVDMEAVVQSDLYQRAEAAGLLARQDKSDYRQHFLAELEFEGTDDFERVLSMHDFDPFADFKSLTLFGSLAEDSPAVVLLEFGPKAQAILADLRAQPDHSTIDHAGFAFDAWIGAEVEVNGYLFEPPASADGAMTIAVSEDRDALLRAARVLTGDEASLAVHTGGVDSALRARAGAGSFVYVEVAGKIPGVETSDPASCVFSSARALRFDLREQAGLFSAQLSLQTEHPDEARRVAQVMQGVIALASLAASESPESQALAELGDGVNVTSRDAELIADFEIESSRAVQLAAEHRERSRAKRQSEAR
jgi:hypothetical protein